LNQKQKEALKKLRGAGRSYLEIADQLGLSQNTVKSFCQRNRLASAISPEPETINVTLCRECNSPLIQTSGKKKKLFCSDHCRLSWWNAHQETVKRKNGRTFSCQTCGRDFMGYGKRERKYCSRSCYGLSKVVRR